tara:strand:+ start:207 stop:560 length:354 start_codon:yes stop_codon:yes gene_type:complete
MSAKLLDELKKPGDFVMDSIQDEYVAALTKNEIPKFGLDLAKLPAEFTQSDILPFMLGTVIYTAATRMISAIDKAPAVGDKKIKKNGSMRRGIRNDREGASRAPDKRKSKRKKKKSN